MDNDHGGLSTAQIQVLTNCMERDNSMGLEHVLIDAVPSVKAQKMRYRRRLYQVVVLEGDDEGPGNEQERANRWRNACIPLTQPAQRFALAVAQAQIKPLDSIM